MRKNTYYIVNSGVLRGYSDRQWLDSLKRSETGLPKGWSFWKWQFVRPEHAWLSKRGWVCFKPEWLPAGTQKIEIAEWPLIDYIEWEEPACVVPDCPC
jgi:hypothetical protein